MGEAGSKVTLGENVKSCQRVNFSISTDAQLLVTKDGTAIVGKTSN